MNTGWTGTREAEEVAEAIGGTSRDSRDPEAGPQVPAMNDARNVRLVATTSYATIRSCCAISAATGIRSRSPIPRGSRTRLCGCGPRADAPVLCAHGSTAVLFAAEEYGRAQHNKLQSCTHEPDETATIRRNAGA